ncbi:MAG: putative nucleic acid-binding protein [Cyclobacteriaceae bacterium]|jgi:predicted nucleic acid-binding protein
MNGNSVLLDTNIVLYLLSGDKVLSDLLFNKKLYISFVTQLELLSYPDLEKEEKFAIQKFLKDCIIVDIKNSIKEEVIGIRSSIKIKLPDSVILGTSAYLGIPVITSDKGLNKADTVDVIYYQKS